MLLVEKLLGTSSAVAANYIEDVFSTYLYTGTGANQSIQNDVRLIAGATNSGWVSYVSGLLANQQTKVAVDSSGNVYFCGTVSVSSVPNAAVVKFNSSGVIQWQRYLGGATTTYAKNVAVDSSGNVYITGNTGTGSTFILTAKYNSSGTLQWQRRFGDGSPLAYGTGIAVDSSSNVHILGYRASSNGAVIIKYNTSGTLQWQRSLGGDIEDGGIAVDSSSNIYISSRVTGVSTSYDALIAKYDSSGTIQWQRRLGNSGDLQLALGCSVDSSANVYISGRTASSGAFIAKYDTSGTYQWSRELNSGFGYGIAADNTGNSYVVAAGGYMAKYDSSGVIQWQRSLTNVAEGIAVDNAGYVYASGGTTLAKLPADGTGQAVYKSTTLNAVYSNSSLTDTAAGYTSATTTLTSSTSTIAEAAATLTDSAGSLTTESATTPTGTSLGGMVWIKGRSGATDHALYDTVRGATFDIATNLTTAQTTQTTGLTTFLSNGFTIGSLAKINTSTATYVSWTFRKQAKFFDVVTYTGTGVARTISHNLGSVPGWIIIKRTDTTSPWSVYTNTGGNLQYMFLNTTDASSSTGGSAYWNSTSPTSTVFSLGTSTNVNANGGTYVAYLFAHNAGGFGANGTDNVITCGGFETDASGNATVTLGYEPQFLLTKAFGTAGTNWNINDFMRGMPVGSDPNTLFPNLNNAETSSSARISPTATGFIASGGFVPSTIYIYIAIRRGPMKTPTTGTSVFSPIASSAATGTALTTSFPVDLQIAAARNTVYNRAMADRVRGFSTSTTGSGQIMYTNNTAAEAADATSTLYFNNTGFQVPGNLSSVSSVYWNFRRAPGFFDIVGYTGTGVARTVTHGLGVTPELIIAKNRSVGSNGVVYSATIGASNYLILNSTAASAALSNVWNNTAPTSSVFTVGSGVPSNGSGNNIVAYLFATLAGVSKVGSYSGSTGATLQINCGFTTGARFVLIKRTDTTGDWYAWDSARGIASGNDPYMLFNSSAAEVTSTDYIDTYSAGFEISSTAPAAINANGGSFIFWAVA